MKVNPLYDEVLKLKEQVEATCDISTMHAARLKLMRLSLEKENVALIKHNDALRNTVLKISGQPLEAPSLDFTGEELETFKQRFKKETLTHLNRILFVAHSV